MLRESIQRVGFLFRMLTRRKLDALDLLESDHIRLEMLFLQWRFTSAEDRRSKIFESIRQEILHYSYLEEVIFYPGCEKVAELKKMVLLSAQDHKKFKSLLREISHLSPKTDKASSKMKLLSDELSRHVSFEENELFSQVRIFMKKSSLDKLGRDLRQFKQHKVQKAAA